uniref:Uncharacterized protein n=1 Tax=Tetranychus urticae TaxID=32264 RepID=T1JWQ1_TETUR
MNLLYFCDNHDDNELMKEYVIKFYAGNFQWIEIELLPNWNWKLFHRYQLNHTLITASSLESENIFTVENKGKMTKFMLVVMVMRTMKMMMGEDESFHSQSNRNMKEKR